MESSTEVLGPFKS